MQYNYKSLSELVHSVYSFVPELDDLLSVEFNDILVEVHPHLLTLKKLILILVPQSESSLNVLRDNSSILVVKYFMHVDIST